MDTILIVEDKESLGRMLKEALEGESLAVDLAGNGEDALRRLGQGPRYSVVLTDLRLPGIDGIEVTRRVKERDPDCPVVVMTAFGTIEDAVEAMKIGAYDFVQKPIDIDYLQLLLRRCLEGRRLRAENVLLKEEFQRRFGFPTIIGESPGMHAVSEQLQKVAPTDSSVLLLGESGTGKELFARAIHQLSPRRDRPFVAINCAAIPDTLIENELFGHEKGAYTGASGRQIGRFELADTGTVFLDEIGELGIGVQSKILRVLQERKFERIGGTSTISVDVRIICATNRNLQDDVKTGRFRDDLFFRVSVFPITIPPLRARRSDIDLLADHFVARSARELGKRDVRLSEEARKLLREHDWPGNIRELENCIERGVILCDRNTIEPKDLNIVQESGRNVEALRELFDLSGTLADATSRAAAAVEKLKIEDEMHAAPDRNTAAERLGISYRTLLSKLKEHGVD